jgi:tetratricopeptide (TPR) repeat protein/tRNA A-37 threonylcarbamoyl transferase component Bud32
MPESLKRPSPCKSRSWRNFFCIRELAYILLSGAESMEEDIKGSKFLSIIGCSIEKNGMTISHEAGHIFLPWDSISHSFGILFKKKNMQKVPLFIMLNREIPELLYFDGSNLSSVKFIFEGSIYIRHISAKSMLHNVATDTYETEFRDIVTKICSKFSWTYIDTPLRKFIQGDRLDLPTFSTIDEVADYCEKIAGSLGTVSKVISLTEEPLKEIRTITGPVTKRDEWKEGTIKENRYVIQSVLKGGMGVVFIALDQARSKFIAIKTFQDKYLWEETISAQFTREAEIWVNLGRHRNIVQAEMVKIIDGKPYVFIEYVQGQDLETRLRGGILPIESALDYAIQFCNGMSYAFTTLGLVHRDIKPSNCFITRENVLKISDFGLGKLALESSRERESSAMNIQMNSDILSSAAMVGTLPFMAPELFSDIKGASIKTDIYAFGVMLYTMVTGKNPFLDDDPTEIIDRHVTFTPEDPSLINPGVPAALKNLLFKCLEKDPDARYNDFDEIKEELKRLYREITGHDHVEKGQEDAFTEEDWIKKGLSLSSLGFYKEALIPFDEALKLNPRSPAKIHKCTSYTALGQFDEGLTCIDEILAIHPDHWKMWYQKGDTLRQAGRFDEALACFKKALTLTSQTSPITGQIGKVYEEQGKLSEALEYYEQALSQNAKIAEIWDYKGTLLMKMNRPETAQECFSEATEINPRFIEAWFHRATAFYELGFFAEALKANNLALSLNGEFIPSLIGLGNCYRELKDFNRALEFFNKALLLSPENLDAHLAKVRLLIENSYFEEALDDIDMILEKTPDNPQVLFNLAQTFYELGLYSESLQLCTEIAKKEKSSWMLSLLTKSVKNWIREHDELVKDIAACEAISDEDVYRDLNSVLCMNCSVDGAIAMLLHFRNRGPVDRIYNILSQLYRIKGDFEEAANAIERVLASTQVDDPLAEREKLIIQSEIEGRREHADFDSRGAQEWMIQGLQKFESRDFNESLKAFQKALNIDSGLYACWYFAGKAFEHMGNAEEARRYINNFIQCFPHSPGYYREIIVAQGSTMDYEELEKLYKKWIGCYPADHRAWKGYLTILMAHGYHEKARLIATEIVKNYVNTWFLPRTSAEFRQIYGLLQLFLKRYTIAQKTFNELLNDYPEHEAASLALGKTLELSGKLKEAEEIYTGLLGKEDISLMAAYQLAGLELKMNARKKAMGHVNMALQKRANLTEMMYRKAQIHFALREFGECMEICYKLFAKDKKFIAAPILHSLVLLERHKPATDPLTRALSANPKNMILLKSLALTYLQMKDYLKSLAAFDLILSWNKMDVESVMAQGICHYKIGNFQKALAAFQGAAEINYKNTDIWLFLGAIHSHMGNAKIAETLFRQALQINNVSPDILVNLGIFLQEQGRLVEAQACAEKALRIDPNHGPAWLSRARCCRIYGNIEEAQKSVRSALLFLPEELKTWVLRGIIEYEAGDIDISVQSFKKASEINPEEPVIWYDLALLAMKDEKVDHALKWIHTALQLKPKFFEALFLKALCFKETFKEAQAEQLFNQCFELDPEKFNRWKKLQAANDSLLAPVKPLELSTDPFFLPDSIRLPQQDPITIFHLEKPEDVLSIVKDLSSQDY